MTNDFESYGTKPSMAQGYTCRYPLKIELVMGLPIVEEFCLVREIN